MSGVSGLPIALRLQWRVQRLRLLVWVVALGAGMAGTAAAVASLYDTPAKIHSYAVAVGSGTALVAMNGRVEGIDSLGGVIQNEFGFLAAFLLPLLGISLVAGSTRREEDSGRLELVLGGRLARWQPTLAALVLAAAAITVTAAVFAGGLVAAGVPVGAALCYAAALASLALVFAGVAGLAAQLMLHSRGVYACGLLVLVLAYVARGAGDATGSWLTWLSPLGWAERAAPFGATRWWVLAIPLLTALILAGAAVLLAARRDLGSALVRPSAGPGRASAGLRTELGLAARLHRPALLGWLAGSVLLAGMMGALAQPLLDAMAGNPSMAAATGLSGAAAEDGLLGLTLLYLAVIGSGYLVQSIGSLRAEEGSGRLETRLAGAVRRPAWLAAHVTALLAGLVLICLAGSGVLALTAGWSLDHGPDLSRAFAAGLAYLPAELVLAGLALTLFGLMPKAFPLAWAAFAGTAFIALLGAGLRLPSWVLDLAPTTHVGHPPDGTVAGTSLLALTLLAAALLAIAFVGFRRRGIPQG